MHRIEHNLKLRQEWFAARKLRVGVPPISEQLPTVIINKRALFPYGYNPSIIRWRGRTLMAYRYHPNGAGVSRLAMAELDDNFRVTSNQPIDLPVGSMEDPRLFTYGDNLCMSYVCSNMPVMNPKCTVRWGVLREDKPWKVDGQWLVNYGKNDGTAMEKNWIFFQHEETLKVIYQTHPTVEILTVDQERVLASETRSNSTHCKWGRMRGGTRPLKLSDGRSFRFFHSRLDNDSKPIYWRYYVGACVVDDAGNITAVSRKPILTGSEHDDMAKTELASCSHHKSRVVFPLGVIEKDGAFLLSVGINDSACGLVTVKEENLNL